MSRPLGVRPPETNQVTGHRPLDSPGNDWADSLAKVCWLETVPTGLSG